LLVLVIISLLNRYSIYYKYVQIDEQSLASPKKQHGSI